MGLDSEEYYDEAYNTASKTIYLYCLVEERTIQKDCSKAP